VRRLYAAVIGRRPKTNGATRRAIVIAYLFKERSAGAIPPCREFLAIVGVDSHRRDIDTVIHNVIKEPFKEYCSGRGGFLFALAYPHRSRGALAGGYLVRGYYIARMRPFQLRNVR